MLNDYNQYADNNYFSFSFWINNIEYHYQDNPQSYHEQPLIRQNLLHRNNNLPTVVHFHKGFIYSETFYTYGKLHNIDPHKPSKTDTMSVNDYYIYGIKQKNNILNHDYLKFLNEYNKTKDQTLLLLNIKSDNYAIQEFAKQELGISKYQYESLLNDNKHYISKMQIYRKYD